MSESINNLVPKTRPRDIEKIIRYLKEEEDNRIELSDDQEELMTRLMQVDRWLMKDSPKVVVNTIRGAYPDVSHRQAYRYIEYSRQVFNSISTARDVEFGFRLIMEWAYEARELALRRKDSRAYVSLIGKLIDTFGLKDHDPNAFDPSEIGFHQYVMQLNFIQGDEKIKQKVSLDDIQSLPTELMEQVKDDVHQHMGLNDLEQLIDQYEEEAD